MINSLELGKKVIKEKIPLIPKNPGVYKMISSTGEILYIGKAKNIPNRLKSYVTESNLPIRTERMLSLTHNLETTTTSNESEALLLEANLIKKHKPRYNILLRDDKSFPYIYIGNKDKWPQLTKLRGKKSKTGYYFGPFASIGSANWTIKILQKIFLLRVCDDTVFKNRERPCILYQIKRCSAPCVGHINEKDYKIAWLGHSAFIINLSGKIILLDPMLGSHAAPVPIPSLKRYNKIEINDKTIIRGLRSAKLNGRLSKLTGNTSSWIMNDSEILIDGCHNPSAAKVIRNEMIKANINNKKNLLIILGLKKNKKFWRYTN